MSVSFFENAYFLRSIGWAIANNFWQAGALWGIYMAVINSNKKLSALVKYYFSLAFLFLSFGCFVVTIIQNYQLLLQANAGQVSFSFFSPEQTATVLPFFAVAYLAMLGFYIVKFILNYFQLQFLSTKGLQKSPVNIRIYATQASYHLGIKRKVQVWLSTHVDVPSVTGFFKPLILLPVAMINNLTTDQINAVLLHELAHIRRNDFIINLLQSFITLVLFFNPFAILLDKAVKKERENCCDDQVLNFNFDRVAYAKALLLLEEYRFQQVTLALAATNSKKLLSQRIKRLFTAQNPQTNIDLFQKLQLSGLSLLLFIGMCFLMPPLHQNFKAQHIAGMDNSWIIPAKIFAENDNESNGLSVKSNINNLKVQTFTTAKVKSPVVTETTKTIFLSKIKAKKRVTITENKEFILTMVNDELLENKALEATVSTVVNKEKDSVRSVFVKIEEQQSGQPQTNTFYLKVNDTNGKTAIQPLIIIKKFKAIPSTPKKIGVLKTTIQVRLASKKIRVTT